jgi:phage major head subunit gpT-like protein
MIAKVNTQSNCFNLNGQWVKVKEIIGTRVTCICNLPGLGTQTIDFKLTEIIEIDTTKQI